LRTWGDIKKKSNDIEIGLNHKKQGFIQKIKKEGAKVYVVPVYKFIYC